MRLHDGEPTLVAGTPLGGARAAIVAVHGRGASPEKIVGPTAAELGELASRVTFVAPEARHGTWYPKSFLAPFEENQPWLDSALERVGQAVSEVERAGVPAERIVVFGFSQGACLASEFVARNPRRYGALVAATGGRIGPPGTSFVPTAVEVASAPFVGTPVHLSAGDPDSHVPWSRVEETAAFFGALGAGVTAIREPGFPHAVHPTAWEFLRARVAELLAA